MGNYRKNLPYKIFMSVNRLLNKLILGSATNSKVKKIDAWIHCNKKIIIVMLSVAKSITGILLFNCFSLNVYNQIKSHKADTHFTERFDQFKVNKPALSLSSQTAKISPYFSEELDRQLKLHAIIVDRYL